MPPEHVQRIVDALMTARSFRWLASVMQRCHARARDIAAERERLVRAGALIDDLPSDIETLRRLEQRDRSGGEGRALVRPQPERPQAPQDSEREIAEAAIKYARRHDCSYDVALPEVQRRYARARALAAPAKPAAKPRPQPQRRPEPIELHPAVLRERIIEHVAYARSRGRDLDYDTARVEVERFFRDQPREAKLWNDTQALRESVAELESQNDKERQRLQSPAHAEAVRRAVRYATLHRTTFEAAAEKLGVDLGPRQEVVS